MEQAYQEPGEKTLDNPEILSTKSTQERWLLESILQNKVSVFIT
jgi:hypothetical protein